MPAWPNPPFPSARRTSPLSRKFSWKLPSFCPNIHSSRVVRQASWLRPDRATIPAVSNEGAFRRGRF